MIERLPSGAMRVRVFAGYDPLTQKRHYLSETVSVGRTERETLRAAEKVRTKLLSQIDERRNPRTRVTVSQMLDRWLELVKIESLYARLRKCREHCGGRSYVEHRTTGEHVCDEHLGAVCKPRRPDSCRACARACRPHVCSPLSDGSIRVVHSILKTSLNRAVRWKWIAVNPIAFVDPPRIPTPDPSPPNADEAAAILAEAWKDPDWGMLIWLAMVVGARRGELSALRWSDIDLDRAVLTVGRSIGQIGGTSWEKDTKTHQRRRISLDAAMVEMLVEYRDRCAANCSAVNATPDADVYLFSRDPDNRTPLRPGTITQRYGRMIKTLGLDTHFHALRHYSATELIAAGVDPRTVAGRLGHGGGGATTLRVYSAWVPESDRRAADIIAARMPARVQAGGG